MSDAASLDGVLYISTADAAKRASLSADYIALLSRQGKIRAKQVDRNWLIDPSSLDHYLTDQNALKEKRSAELSSELRRVAGQPAASTAARAILHRHPSPRIQSSSQHFQWLVAAPAALLIVGALFAGAFAISQQPSGPAADATSQNQLASAASATSGQTPAATSSRQNVFARAETSKNNSPVINQYITSPVQRVVESEPLAVANFVTQDQLNATVSALGNSLRQLIATNSFSASASPPLGGGSSNTIAAANAIDQLSGTTLNNVTVNGVSGLSASDIPTDIIAANYLPLSGGTVTGTLNVQTLSASSTSYGVLTATDASTTNFSIFNDAYFGGTATSSFDSAGDLTVTGNTTLQNATTSLLFVKSQLSAPSATIGALTATGTLAVSGTSAFTGLATFGSASTSIFSAFGPAYFGGTATSSFGTNGALTTPAIFDLGASSFANSDNFLGLTAFGATATTTINSAGAISTPSITANAATAYSASFGATATSTFDSAGDLTVAGNTTLQNATTTNFFATTASSTNLFAQTASLGALSAGTLSLAGTLSAQGGGALGGTFSGAPIFSGIPIFNDGLTAYASSTIGNGTQTGGLTINGGATTTGEVVLNGATTTAAHGIVAPCFSNDGVTCITGTGGGGGITSITAGTGLTGGTITTSGTIALDLTHANSWTGLQQFSAASSSLFSAYGPAYFGGTATSTFASNGTLTTPAIFDLGASSFANADNFFGLTSFGGTATTTIATNGTISTPSITANSATAYSASFGATGTTTINSAGAISTPALTASSATAYNATIGALTATSSLAVYNSASFGATATSSFNSAGQLTLASALSIGNGGTGTSTPANYGNILSWTGSNYQAIATSTLGLAVSSFASHNISQWTNDAGYLTSLAGAASSTLLSDNNTFSGNDTFNNTIAGSISGNAGTATALQNARTINNVSFNGTSNISINAASSTLLGDSNTFSGVDSFTNASSNFGGTWQTFSPSHFQTSGTYLTGLGNYATTTGTAISISTSTLSFNGLTLGNTFAVLSNGISVTPTVSGTISNSGLANSTIGATSPNSTLTLGTAASLGSTFTADLNLAHGNWWTALQQFTNASTSEFTATSSIYLANTEGAILTTNSNGLVQNYGGATCTNQFVRSLNGAGAATCATVQNTDLANSSISFSSSDSSLTVPAPISLGSSGSFTLNLTHANNWTGLQSFANASSTLATVSTLWLPNITAGALLYANGSNQVAAAAATYPLQFTGGTLSLAFGTTTSNTWNQLQLFSAGASTTNESVFGSLWVGGTATTTISGTATSTFGAGISASYLNLSGTSATSTASNGLNLSAGCFAVQGTCVGQGTNNSSTGSGGGQLLETYATSSVASNVSITFTAATSSAPVITYSGGLPTAVNLPSNTSYIVVEEWGGGGGGGNSGAGGVGGTTYFANASPASSNAIFSASGGGGGGTSSNNPGGGGTGSGGDINLTGTTGGAGEGGVFSGTGGSAPRGGGGAGPNGSNAGAAFGGGGGGNATVTGGGGGGYSEKLISSLSATYYYTVSAGGTAGTGATGATGGPGGIEINVYTTGISNGSLASGTAGQFAFYNAAGTNLSATSSIFVNTANSYIGIGTTTPDTNLSIFSATKPSLEFSLGAGLGNWTEGIDTANGNSFEIASSTQLGTNPRFVINGAGNVGIGTISPAYNANSATFLAVNNVAANGYSEIGAGGNVSTAGDSAGAIEFFNSSLSAADKRIAAIWGATDGATNSGDLDFYNYNAGTQHETMSILYNGNVGIGTTSPTQAKLVVVGGPTLDLDGAGNDSLINWDQNGSTEAQTYYQQATSRFYVSDGSGGVYLTSGATSWSSASDERLKADIQSLSVGTNPLASIQQLTPVSFDWKDATQDASQGLQYGFIAQNVQSVFPSLVSEGGTTTITLANGTTQAVTNTLGLNYTGLISPTIAAVQELNDVFNATNASTTQPSILSLYQGTTTPAVTIDQFGNFSIGTSTATSTTNQKFCLNGECTTELPFFTSATSTATSTPSLAVDFLSAIENALTQWLANATNGIDQFFAQVGNFQTTNAQTSNASTTNTQTLNASSVCLTQSNGQQVCVTGDQLAALLSQSASAQTPESVTSSASNSSDSAVQNSSSTSLISVSSTTPPVIQINGDNPATIQVGATYTDLGATITGPQADLNLGITTYVNGTEMNPVQIDTTQAATDTIDYVATDQSGLTATSTRTVVVVAPDSAESPTGSTSTRTVIIEAAPSIVPTSSASSTGPAVATSTATTTTQ